MEFEQDEMTASTSVLLPLEGREGLNVFYNWEERGKGIFMIKKQKHLLLTKYSCALPQFPGQLQLGPCDLFLNNAL